MPRPALFFTPPTAPTAQNALAADMQNLSQSLLDDLNTPSQYLWNDGLFAEAAALCVNLRTNHPQTRFFGIGTSPAPLMYGLTTLGGLTRSPIKAAAVPFSGRFMKLVENRWKKPKGFALDPAAPEYKYFRRYTPLYRHFLKAYGLDPAKIVRVHAHLGLQTAVVDNMQSGTSFASFVYFMHQWARDTTVDPRAFSHAFKAIALVDRKVSNMVLLDPPRVRVPLDRIWISEDLRVALNSNESQESDRFVPHYGANEWDAPPPESPASPAKIRVLKQGLAEALRKRVPAPRLAKNAY